MFLARVLGRETNPGLQPLLHPVLSRHRSQYQFHILSFAVPLTGCREVRTHLMDKDVVNKLFLGLVTFGFLVATWQFSISACCSFHVVRYVPHDALVGRACCTVQVVQPVPHDGIVATFSCIWQIAAPVCYASFEGVAISCITFFLFFLLCLSPFFRFIVGSFAG